MRAVVQRVSYARVSVAGAVVGACGTGFLALVGAGKEDDEARARKLADRLWGMRVFPDTSGKMNLTLRDFEATAPGRAEPNVLAVSNFTVYGDASQRRPSFSSAAPYEEGERLFRSFVQELESLGARVATGVYGADMLVELANDGPVTLILET